MRAIVAALLAVPLVAPQQAVAAPVYLPEGPSANRLAGPRPWAPTILFALIGLVATGAGGAVLVDALRRARRQSRLRAHGVAASAAVTALRARALKINGVTVWRLDYEYGDSQGRRHASSIDLLATEAQQWKVGDVGLVRYDPAQPDLVAWLGRST